MLLSVKDACRLLNVPERTLYRWIRAAALPARKIGDDYRFNRVELIEWATREHISFSPGIFEKAEGEREPLSIAAALREGGVHEHVPGTDKASVLRAVVSRLNLAPAIDRDLIFSILVAREALGSTGVGEGIAIPHVRNPLVVDIERPQIALCYLEHAVDFAAPDRQPVSVLFTLVCPTVRSHLQILSRLALLLKATEFRAAVRRHLPMSVVEPIAQAIESRNESSAGDEPPPTPPGLTSY